MVERKAGVVSFARRDVGEVTLTLEGTAATLALWLYCKTRM